MSFLHLLGSGRESTTARPRPRCRRPRSPHLTLPSPQSHQFQPSRPRCSAFPTPPPHGRRRHMPHQRPPCHPKGRVLALPPAVGLTLCAAFSVRKHSSPYQHLANPVSLLRQLSIYLLQSNPARTRSFLGCPYFFFNNLIRPIPPTLPRCV
ncbi:uncharacterized protein J3D65DRAFT_627873 [Phyllosticta citribraziliensis]|uniref:Uncharacterized protein n=1 Tax=Phyllosticta citribraziliensis TaxID=989973 RepID=A0ABR1LQE6_9PEZI